jgi:predicted ATPase with chaperone activity
MDAPSAVTRHQMSVSAPLRDRLDIHVEVLPKVLVEARGTGPGASAFGIN